MCSGARLAIMKATIEGDRAMALIRKMKHSSSLPSWWGRIFWLVVIWCGSVMALFIVSLILRMIMSMAGLKIAH
ncbi:DUF2474 domain-containing protein [Sodalis sp. RH22]|uniref:DUF2474 domain-containing protein n=1 Tax=Sodalis sp. RH22 TaxID=3394337 RepID=UPI0039B68C8B